MTTVLVPRLVATAASAATLSLLTMVAVITATGASKLRWDGSFCTTSTCAPTAFAQMKPPKSGTI